MNRTILIAFLLILSPVLARSQSARVIKFSELEKLLHVQNDTTYVINFWATWCTGCVKEFPNFQRLAADNTNANLKVIFVSLDFKKNLKTALDPFLRRHNVTQDVYLLDETDYNTWIDKVDSSWEGSLPGTLIYNNLGRLRKFYSQEFTEQELADAVRDYLPLTPILSTKHE